MAKSDARLAGHFAKVKTFHYRIGVGNTVFASSQYADLTSYRLLASIDVATHREQIDNAGKTTTVPATLCPNLKKAYFDPLPATTEDFAIAFCRTTDAAAIPLLASVEEVHIVHRPYAIHSSPPCFNSLGMSRVVCLDVHHSLGAEVGQMDDRARTLADYLGYQRWLKRVNFRLAHHLNLAIGGLEGPISNGATAAHSIIVGSGGDLVSDDATWWAIFEYTQGIDDLVRSLSRKLPTPGGLENCNKLPALTKITIDLGRNRLVQDVLRDLKFQMFANRHDDIYRMSRANASLSFPDVEIRAGQGERWLLVSANEHLCDFDYR
ncbi:hypothetical protein EMMF5_000225 [Cystobasidiomycetes sp. EMM_F5]